MEKLQNEKIINLENLKEKKIFKLFFVQNIFNFIFNGSDQKTII